MKKMRLDQSRAPIYEALERFRKMRVVPFDVPGHKHGRGNPELTAFLGQQCMDVDVNSMKPLDNLCHPVSVIREAEELAADAFGAAHAFLMVGGNLTQSSLLLIGPNVHPDYVRQIINLTQTTSGSYLLMSSLDISRRNLALRGRQIFHKVEDMAEYAREEINAIGGYYAFGKELRNGNSVFDFDATKLSVNTRGISWQWAYRKKFEDAGLVALLGCGFDPGVTQAYCAYAKKHEFDTIDTIDILDCNGGDHGYAFATNFNPEINLREVSAPGSYWEDGHWVEIPAMSIKREYDFDQVGQKDMYLLHHEEIESLAPNIPEVQRIRFFMTFGQSYLMHMKCLENVGMLSTTPINFEGKETVPIQFLKALLPDPASLGPRTHGKTNIGCIFTGKKDGQDKTYYIYNVCDHQACYREVGSQAISYTTGVPAMCGAMMLLTGKWNTVGVHTVEEFDPDPFLEALDKYGLPRSESHNPVLGEDGSLEFICHFGYRDFKLRLGKETVNPMR